ncbi:MAG TPA: transglutaminase [Oscillatoriales cyanobacterium M59_W2019_021]|nr:MAG: transglutaminase [Cyanobacteria bacterium J055]HIK32921.1 transglutaminase [Oscillatoriales cyanobacterium M4454_W2019_049]HIK50039.1 transglutaminase [Oscillatoriales cyanobacterium M59_W2019_021]
MKHSLGSHTIRPHGVYALHGLASFGKDLIAIDTIRGYLVRIDCIGDDTEILNAHQTREAIGATGLALWDDTLWYTKSDRVYSCQIGDWTPQPFATLPYPANGVAACQGVVYVSCQRLGCIFAFHRETGREITKFYAPGVGIESLTVRGEELWVSDTVEQTVYCLDRATGDILFSALTPFESPTGLTFHPHPETGEEILYVAYAKEEPYIRDNPNSSNPYQLTFRDRTFIHPLHFSYSAEKRYTLSNGYLVEMSYVEELSPLDAVELDNLQWRIGLPTNTPRQTVKSIEPVGLPFTVEERDGQQWAVFEFDRLQPHEARIFGWKAVLEVRSIKYNLTPPDVEKLGEIPPEYQERYLSDNDNLAMDKDIVQRSARYAIGSETNWLRQVLSIRDYVYERLDYGIKPHIDTPDIVLDRGKGSCGEYVGVLLALLRLNGIPCRTVGRYKCPAKPELRNVPLEPDYNHVWLEFYLPGWGWIPMESNPDDITDRGPYPLRFFMGLAWYHIEMTKGDKFETLMRNGEKVPKEVVSLGDLAINHVRFRILDELEPVQ